MSEDRIRHLEIILSAILRQAQNSFMYKGWAVTLVAAILALAATEDLAAKYLYIALIPAFTFWGLDAFYLREERLFRAHYAAVRSLSREEWLSDPFSMDVKPYETAVDCWAKGCFSRSVWPLYAPLVVLVMIITCAAR